MYHLTLNFDVKFPVHLPSTIFSTDPSSKRAGRPPKARCKDGKGAILDLEINPTKQLSVRMSLVDVKMDPKGEQNGICMYLLMEMLK